MRLFPLLVALIFLSCLPALGEEVVRKFSPRDFTASFSGVNQKFSDVISLDKPPVTKEHFGFKGTVDYDKVELGGLEMRVAFKGGETYSGMIPVSGYKWMRGSAKNQAFFFSFDCSKFGDSLEKLESLKLRVTLPQGGSVTIKSLELVQW